MLGSMTDEAKRAEQERRLAGLRLRYLGLRRKLALEYPEQRELVLPTRFGNVLRAFEMYAGNVYGVESIHAWPRLLAVVPKDYQETLADARAPVDFFVSLVFVSFVLGGVALARCAAEFPSGLHGIQPWWFAGVCTMAFVVSRLCYLAAVSTAIAWGETVKSAFDLYLPSLATALDMRCPPRPRSGAGSGRTWPTSSSSMSRWTRLDGCRSQRRRQAARLQRRRCPPRGQRF
ncbi:hypothetical protein ACKZDW_05475 (plasmid) [Ralstonia syzygii subsp. celebesensis]